VVGNELFTTFNIATDVFAFSAAAFGINSISFANGAASSLPSTGVNTIVLQNFETPFGAGTAADLIAAQLTSPTPGFFIYFNSGLDVARLVYSTDLSTSTSDLKVLARLTNLTGQTGRDAFSTFTAANFQIAATVPEQGSPLILALAAAALLSGRAWFGRKPLSAASTAQGHRD
jgi:hypothetical protein